MSRHTFNKEMVVIGLLAIILAILATADAAPLVNSVGKATTTFMTTTTRRYSIHCVSPHLYETLKKTRGGATLVDSDDEYDSEEDEYDDQEEEEDVVLTKSAVAAAAKAKSKKTKVSKKAVSASLSRSKTASISKKKKISVLRKIPYIVKACMNPFTVMSMTKAYFASLFNVNYLEEVSAMDGWVV